MLLPVLLIVCVALGSTPASAQLIRFEFNNEDPFDGGTVDATDERMSEDGTETAVLTLIDVFAPEYVPTDPEELTADGDVIFEATGAILSGPDSGVVANIGNNGTLGVNNVISNGQFETVGGATREVLNFNLGEGIVLAFNREVLITELDFASIDLEDGVDPEGFDVEIEGVAGTFSFSADEVDARDIFIDPFDGLVIPADAQITFTGAGSLATSVRIDTITIQLDTSLVFSLGDFDLDGDVDLADLDQYNNQLGNPVLGQAAVGELEPLDFGGDGTVDEADFVQHYETLVETSNGQVGTFAGDANLDGVVDVLGDAFALVSNLGLGVEDGINSWAQGDFNADQTVNVLGDAFLLVANLGNSNAP
ncbi:hypothetical protein N9L06_02075 [Mariniblastus sp.]|nr:hypothetical protein [Mariniblastus sp.]